MTIWLEDITWKKTKNALHLVFENGVSFDVTAFILRANSPSAEVQGHGGVKPHVHIDPNVRITDLQPVGNYALRIIFDDGHATGLYTWNWLYGLRDKKD
jgi:DUF971 family protein